MANETFFSTDAANKKLIIERTFDSSLDKVWNAWTKKDLLDKWWAPKPYRAQTKILDFKPGGYWLYAMVDPDGLPQWCRLDYKEINPLKNFSGFDAFCDEKGIVNNGMPRMTWLTSFAETGGATKVRNEISFQEIADLEKIIQMGFEQGYKAGLQNLAELLLEEA